MKKKSISAVGPDGFVLKIGVLIIIMLAATGNVWSQQPTAVTSNEETIVPKYRWGVKGGVNSASEYSSEGQTKTRFGVHVGFFMESTISHKVDIQPELVYSMQGGIDKNDITDKIDYINLPVMFKIYVNRPRTFSVDVGPQLGYMIRAKYTYDGETTDIYDSDNINKFDAALCAGVSYKFNPKFQLSIRINYSLTKISDLSDNVNGVGQISLGYSF